MDDLGRQETPDEREPHKHSGKTDDDVDDEDAEYDRNENTFSDIEHPANGQREEQPVHSALKTRVHGDMSLAIGNSPGFRK